LKTSSQYTWVEIAIGTPRNRGVLIQKTHLKSKIMECIKEGIPLYRSTFLYDTDVYNLAEESGSIKSYFGERAIDNVLIDIDKGDNSDEYTLRKTQSILYGLEELGLQHNNMQPYFSGSGYHIIIPASCFNFEISKNLPYTLKQTMKKMLKDIDLAIYTRTSIYRVPHTINQKTKLYKIPLTINEVFGLSSEKIKEMAKEPRLAFPYNELIGDGELEEHISEGSDKIREFRKVTEPRNIVTCVQRMYNVGPQEGSRNNTILRIASHYKRNGINSAACKAALLHWNNNMLDEDQVIEKVEYVYNSGVQYGCNDAIMHKHCNPRCIHYKRKDLIVDVKTATDMQEALHERMTTDYSGRSIQLSSMLGIDEECEILPGELVTIFGPTGSNKTTLAHNIVLGYDFAGNTIEPKYQVPTLYLSLELSASYLHRRSLQIVSGCDKDYVKENYESLYESNHDLLQHLVVQESPPTVKLIEQKITELQPALVVVDYIDLVETPRQYQGEYEKIKYISHNLSSLAVNRDIIIIQVSQVSREYSRSQVLDLYAGKGSGAIENASRKVIGINGQAKEDMKTISLLKNTDGELFETEVRWTPSFRLRRVHESEIDDA
tara:strand:- start:322 stop:2136 length:1815 start_codon:yes stop_codon:yes gene_type:complete